MIACRNPDLTQLQATQRESLPPATKALLAKIATRAREGGLYGAYASGVAVGKVIYTDRMAKHPRYEITNTTGPTSATRTTSPPRAGGRC